MINMGWLELSLKYLFVALPYLLVEENPNPTCIERSEKV